MKVLQKLQVSWSSSLSLGPEDGFPVQYQEAMGTVHSPASPRLKRPYVCTLKKPRSTRVVETPRTDICYLLFLKGFVSVRRSEIFKWGSLTDSGILQFSKVTLCKTSAIVLVQEKA